MGTDLNTKALLFSTVLVYFSALANAQYAPSFSWVGDLPGGDTYSDCWGQSSDGSTAVGTSGGANGYEAYRWTKAGGIQGLGDLAGGSFGSSAFAASKTGSVIVGQGSSSNGFEAFRWTSAGMSGLGDFSGGDFSSNAYGVSNDGSVVTGFGSKSAGREAFRWTQATGMVGLGSLSGSTGTSEGKAISGDGQTIVGISSSTGVLGGQAFRWTQAGGMQGLGYLPGGVNIGSEAYGVSLDGSTIVGRGHSSNGMNEAFRWTAATGMVGLGDISGGGFESWALATTDDGRMVVGYGTSDIGVEAMMYEPLNGMRSLSAILTEQGLASAFAGWTLRTAHGVSINQFGVPTISGYAEDSGSHSRAFVAVVPEPATFFVLGFGLVALFKRRTKIGSPRSPRLESESPS